MSPDPLFDLKSTDRGLFLSGCLQHHIRGIKVGDNSGPLIAFFGTFRPKFWPGKNHLVEGKHKRIQKVDSSIQSGCDFFWMGKVGPQKKSTHWTFKKGSLL